MTKLTTADRLNYIMKTRKLKQVDIIDLAKPFCEFYKIKLGRNDISQYVSGKVEPRQNKLYILARALNVSEAWLMGYDVPMERVDPEPPTAPTPTLTPTQKEIIELLEAIPEDKQQMLLQMLKALVAGM